MASESVHSIFPRPDAASRAVGALLDAGFSADRLHVYAREGDRINELSLKRRTRVPTGAALGAVLGGVGGLAGAWWRATLPEAQAKPAGLAAFPAELAALYGALIGIAVGTLIGVAFGFVIWKKRGVIAGIGPQTEALAVSVDVEPERDALADRTLRAAGATRVHHAPSTQGAVEQLQAAP